MKRPIIHRTLILCAALACGAVQAHGTTALTAGSDDMRVNSGDSLALAKSRPEVQDELRQAQASGELRLYNSENPADQLLLDLQRPAMTHG